MNLEAIKDATRALLYLDPEPDEKYPFLIHHPFFESDVAYDGQEFFPLFEDLDKARRPYEEMINGAASIPQLLVLVRDPYKMLWYSLVENFLGEEHDDILVHCWICEEWPSRDVNVSLDEMVGFFQRSNLRPDWFPEKMRVYRGVCLDGSPYGMSWTIVEEVARRFASRFGEDGKVYELEVPCEAVLAYIEERGENEVVFDARKFKGEIREVD